MKQILSRNLAQAPSHLNFYIFSVSSNHFSNHDVNIKQVSCIKSYTFNDFVCTIFYPWFTSKFDFRKLSLLSISCFSNKLTILSQNKYFFSESWIIIGSADGKQEFSDNPHPNILALFSNLADAWINRNETILDIDNNKLCTRVASRVIERLKI